MNFLALFGKLGKQPVYVNRQRVSVCLKVADMKKICDGKEDRHFVSIPVTLEITYRKSEQPKMCFVYDKK